MSQWGYQAVWQAGSGGQWWSSSSSIEEFRTRSKEHFDNGFRLVSIDVRRSSDVPRRYLYTAVWRPGSGTQRWRSGMTAKQLADESRERFDQGLRISCIERRDDGKYWAVFQPGGGAQWWRSGRTWNQIRAEDNQKFADGLRLVAIKRYRRQNQTRYLALWRPGSGAQVGRASMSHSQLTSLVATHTNEGLRLFWLDFVDGKYVAVWRPGTGAQWVATGMSERVFRETDKEQRARGRRLRSLRRVRIARASGGAGNQTVILRRQPAGEGNVPFEATFPAIGHTQGSLTGIRNPSQSLRLAFPRSGSTINNCDSPGSVVELQPGKRMSPSDIQSIFDSRRPRLPVTLRACVAGGSSELKQAPVEVDYHNL